jgi:hypothetical protein
LAALLLHFFHGLLIKNSVVLCLLFVPALLLRLIPALGLWRYDTCGTKTVLHSCLVWIITRVFY